MILIYSLCNFQLLASYVVLSSVSFRIFHDFHAGKYYLIMSCRIIDQLSFTTELFQGTWTDLAVRYAIIRIASPLFYHFAF